MNLLTPKIILIDDDQSLCETYKKYFDSYLDYSLNGVFSTVKDALEVYDQIMPNIIFLEVKLPDMCGIESIAQFRNIDPNVKIIMLSEPDDFELVKKAFKYGANGYLTKPISERSLYNALYSMDCQGAFISNDIAKKVIAMFQRKSYDQFSDRETEVIELLRRGATYKSIADSLFVSVSAVNFHIQNIYLKLNVNSKSEALVKLSELEREFQDQF